MTLSGSIDDTEGEALPGVMVSAKDLDRGLTKTAFTDTSGNFHIGGLFPGKYLVSASLDGATFTGEREVVVDEAGREMSALVLDTASASEQQFSGTPWLARLPDGKLKRAFLLGCIGCHQFADPITRRPRSVEDWAQVIETMKAKGLGSYQVGHALMPGLETADLAAWLVENGFGMGAEAPAVEPRQLDPAAFDAVLTEYDVGFSNSVLHDSTVGRDGFGWGLDYVHDRLFKIDPTSGAVTPYELPIKGAGAHTIHPDRDNVLWITLQLVDMVASFDPKTEEFRLYGGFEPDSLPHSFAIDSLGYVQFDGEGNLWLSEFGSNALASLNPKTGEVREYELPLTGALVPTQVGVYGVAMDSHSDVWYSKLNEGVFGKIDTETKEITQYTMPTEFAGPRRLGVDARDRVWIPEFATGKITVFDPEDESFESYPLPQKGDYPYALRVDGARDLVWVCGTGSDSLYRFDPSTEEFTQYPLPNSYTFTRQLAIDYKTGDVWTSYSNIPNEWGGNPAAIVLRLEPGE